MVFIVFPLPRPDLGAPASGTARSRPQHRAGPEASARFMGRFRGLLFAHGDHEPARDRLGRSGSPAEIPFEFAKSARVPPAAAGTPARRFRGKEQRDSSRPTIPLPTIKN